MKYKIQTSAPAIKYFSYVLEASSLDEALSKIRLGEVDPYESHYELTDDEEIDNVEDFMADGGMMAKGGMPKSKEQYLKNLLEKSFYILEHNKEWQGGNLDYSSKEYGYLNDEVDDVQVGYFKDDSADSSYAQELREEGFTLTLEEAINILEHRIKEIDEELDTNMLGEVKKMALGGLFGDSRYNYGRSWKLDHNRHNKRESYEVPLRKRKRLG